VTKEEERRGTQAVVTKEKREEAHKPQRDERGGKKRHITPYD
jgi:hypothetical protein